MTCSMYCSSANSDVLLQVCVHLLIAYSYKCHLAKMYVHSIFADSGNYDQLLGTCDKCIVVVSLLRLQSFDGMAAKPSGTDLGPLRDSMISAASEYAMIDADESSKHSQHHMHHHHGQLIRTALVVELVLCFLFGIVHLVWSCCLKSHFADEDDAPSDLKAPLIKSAKDYPPQDGRVIISPLWAHVMESNSQFAPV